MIPASSAPIARHPIAIPATAPAASPSVFGGFEVLGCAVFDRLSVGCEVRAGSKLVVVGSGDGPDATDFCCAVDIDAMLSELTSGMVAAAVMTAVSLRTSYAIVVAAGFHER